jgi:recombination protein RecA
VLGGNEVINNCGSGLARTLGGLERSVTLSFNTSSKKQANMSNSNGSKTATAQDANKMKALGLALDSLNKTYGKGTVMKMGDSPIMQIEAIPTGSLGLDIALGIGGLPKGRVVEVYGPESSGKTTLALHAIAEAQRKGGIAAFIDAEHAFDKTYAEKLGVDVENLLISQPDNGEQALEITEHLIRSGALDIVVIDSVAALVPRGELEGEMGDAKVGLQARLMSQALRKLTGTISKTGCCCLFINQLRMKIGVMFGNPETTTGGNALKFYASVRLDIRRTGQIKEKEEIQGNRVKVKVVKNKVAPPFRVAEFDIMYGEGISKSGEIVDMGVETGVLQKSGSWYSYESTKLGQGREAVKQLLHDNPELSAELEARIKAIYKPVEAPADEATEMDEE